MTLLSCCRPHDDDDDDVDEDDDDLNIGDIFQYFNIENEKDIFTRKQFCFTDSVNAKHV